MEDFDMAPTPPEAAGGMSTEFMTVISIVILFSVLAFCLLIHLCAKCYWSDAEDPHIVSWRRRMARGRPQPSAAAHRRGLDPTTLQSLPIVVYDPKDFKEGLECAVCLSEVSQGEKARLLPKCNHGFHVECIDMWFKSHATCPLCRNKVISDDSNNSNISVDDDGFYSSDSSFESDNDHNIDDDGSPRAMESPVYPTNVLYWGNETQVRSFGQAENDPTVTSAVAGASSSGVNRHTRERDEMVIDIPPISHHEFCEDCLSSPPTQAQAKTPDLTRLDSLKRWLSFGRRVALTPSPRGSSSCEVHQDQQV